MRILQYLSRFRRRDGGVPRSVLDLCGALVGAGHEVRLLTGASEMVPAAWREAAPGRPHVVELAPWRWARLLRGHERRVVEEALAWCEVAHLHVPWDPLGAQIAAAARRRGVPYLVTAHGMLDRDTLAHRGWRKGAFLALGGARFLRGAAAVVCNSEPEAAQAAEGVAGIRTAVVPLLVDLDPCLALTRAPSRPPLLLFIGRLDPIKGIETLLDAAALLADQGVPMRVEVMGEAADPRYGEALRTRGAALPGVEFLGRLEGATKLERLAAASLLVLPSRHENWGVVLVEALAAGVPVVTTTGVAIWRMLEEKAGAAVVPPDDAPALAAAIRAALADPAALAEKGRRAREWVAAALAPSSIVAAHEALYRAARR